MKDILIIWSKDKIQVSMWLLYLLLAGSLWSLPLESQYFQDIVKTKTQIVLKILVLLFVLSIVLILSLVRSFYKSNHPKLGLTFSNSNGCWHNKDKSQYFCPKCISNMKRSPLQYSDPTDILKCNVCMEGFDGNVPFELLS